MRPECRTTTKTIKTTTTNLNAGGDLLSALLEQQKMQGKQAQEEASHLGGGRENSEEGDERKRARKKRATTASHKLNLNAPPFTGMLLPELLLPLSFLLPLAAAPNVLFLLHTLVVVIVVGAEASGSLDTT